MHKVAIDAIPCLKTFLVCWDLKIYLSLQGICFGDDLSTDKVCCAYCFLFSNTCLRLISLFSLLYGKHYMCKSKCQFWMQLFLYCCLVVKGVSVYLLIKCQRVTECNSSDKIFSGNEKQKAYKFIYIAAISK